MAREGFFNASFSPCLRFLYLQLHAELIAAKDALTRQQYEAQAAIAKRRDEAENLHFLADKQRQVLAAREAEIRSLQDRVAGLMGSLGQDPAPETAAPGRATSRAGRGRSAGAGSRGSSRGAGSRAGSAGPNGRSQDRADGIDGSSAAAGAAADARDEHAHAPGSGSGSAAAAVASELMDVISQLQSEVSESCQDVHTRSVAGRRAPTDRQASSVPVV